MRSLKKSIVAVLVMMTGYALGVSQGLTDESTFRVVKRLENTVNKVSSDVLATQKNTSNILGSLCCISSQIEHIDCSFTGSVSCDNSAVINAISLSEILILSAIDNITVNATCNLFSIESLLNVIDSRIDNFTCDLTPIESQLDVIESKIDAGDCCSL